jgi:hypothetical protein
MLCEPCVTVDEKLDSSHHDTKVSTVSEIEISKIPKQENSADRNFLKVNFSGFNGNDLFFRHLNTLLELGSQRPLEAPDLGSLHPDMTTEESYRYFHLVIKNLFFINLQNEKLL